MAPRKRTYKPDTFYIGVGSGPLEAYIVCYKPFRMRFFGKAQTDPTQTILSEQRRRIAQTIVDRLNAKQITLDECLRELYEKAYDG